MMWYACVERDFSNNDMDKTQWDVYEKITFQCSLSLEVVLLFMDERETEHAGAFE